MQLKNEINQLNKGVEWKYFMFHVYEDKWRDAIPLKWDTPWSVLLMTHAHHLEQKNNALDDR